MIAITEITIDNADKLIDSKVPNRELFPFALLVLYIFSIKFTDCLDFDLSVLIKTSIFINYQNIRYHE